MSVKLRIKNLTGGRKSLYLDMYVSGRRWTEFLKLYIELETTKELRKQNKQTYALAERIHARRLLEIQAKSNGFRKKPDLARNFVLYMEDCKEKRFNSGKNYTTWRSTFNYLNAYTDGFLPFESLDMNWMIGFKEYLMTKLGQNSVIHYMNCLKHCIHDAIRDEIIESSQALHVKTPPQLDTYREFLRSSDIQKLHQTDCSRELVKRAFLFSCFTGLRVSDLQAICWNQIVDDEQGNKQLHFPQRKTKGMEYHPLNETAVNLISPIISSDDRVFSGLKYTAHNLHVLKEWALRAGLTINLSWHVARHTFCCMLLESGVEIYTASKLMGHKELKTTQVYAKIVDSKKKEAVNKLPGLHL